jgi:hypothetical protein
MHPLFERADRLSRDVIGAAIEVHRNKGPGLIESIYERCLLRELGIVFDTGYDPESSPRGIQGSDFR